MILILILGFRPPGPFPIFGDRPPAMLPNGMPFMPNPGFPYSPMPQFPPFMGSGAMPPQLMTSDPTNWNKRVEAFMRRTADAVPGRARSYSGSSSRSSCSTCSSSRSSSRSRSPVKNKETGRQNNDRRNREKVCFLTAFWVLTSCQFRNLQ